MHHSPGCQSLSRIVNVSEQTKPGAKCLGSWSRARQGRFCTLATYEPTSPSVKPCAEFRSFKNSLFRHCPTQLYQEVSPRVDVWIVSTSTPALCTYSPMIETILTGSMGTGDMPEKESVHDRLMTQMSLYPPNTIFFLNVWCFGWEDVVKEVARSFNTKVESSNSAALTAGPCRQVQTEHLRSRPERPVPSQVHDRRPSRLSLPCM